MYRQLLEGAEDDPALLERLLEKEVQAGFLEEVPDLQTAQDRWPQLAIGKANIVHALGRDPRLIIDPTVSVLRSFACPDFMMCNVASPFAVLLQSWLLALWTYPPRIKL